MRNPSDLSTEETFAVGVVVVYLIWEAYFAVRSTPSETVEHREFEYTALGKTSSVSLDRLEDGGSIIVKRWHGQKLELHANPVIDTDTLPATDNDEDGQEGDN